MNWLRLTLKNGGPVMINFAQVNRFYPSGHVGFTTVEFSAMDFCTVEMPFDELVTCVQEAEAAR